MKTLYVATDGEWYPMININETKELVCKRADGSTFALSNGSPIELDDVDYDFIVGAYRNFDIAHDKLKEILGKRGFDV